MKLRKKQMTYLDWAAAAPVSRAAMAAFIKAMSAQGNPGSPHAEGMRAKELLEDARRTIARLLSVKTDGVIFTSGATEANALAIHGHLQALQDLGRQLKDVHVLYLPTAHASVVETMEALVRRGVQVEPLVITHGAVDIDALKKQIRPETVLVSMDAVCGETGTRWDTRDVRRTLNAVRTAPIEVSPRWAPTSRILLHVDASQASFTESLALNHLGADLLTLDAQKVGGVRGIGALVRAHPLIPLVSIMQGGGQEQGLRPGTVNPALAQAFAAALSEAQEGREEFVARSLRLRADLVSTLASVFSDMSVNGEVHRGETSMNAAHILNISFPGRDTDYTVMLLSEAGFMVSTKSACETDSETGSRAVLALTGDKERALSTLRISWGPDTGAKSLRDFALVLIKTIHFQDTSALK
jgi:cysteine desulfurase